MKKVLVVGAARSGISVAKLLVEKHYEVYITDMKVMEAKDKEELQKLGVKIFDGGHDEKLKAIPYDFIVKNPGIPYHAPFIKFFVDNNFKIYTEIEVASWYCNKYNIAAITGTNGKTTATTLLYKMLSAKNEALLAGNIGVPLSQVVLEKGNHEYNVAMELSNFQLLGCEKFNPHISTVMNLSPDHLDYMDNDVEAYYKSKMLIYRNNGENDIFLKNIDDVNINRLANNIPGKVYTFSIYKKADICITKDWITFKDEQLVALDDIKVVGNHNIQNVMVAATMAFLMGIDKNTIRETVSNFFGVEHRLEFVKEISDIKYYNDSKSTNPDSLITALEAFDTPVILLAGGYDKGNDFDFLNNYKEKIKHLYAYGDTKNKIKESFENCTICETLDEAFDKANNSASKGDIILLSPGCASYDQFKNYEDRGNYFKNIVRGM